MRILAIESSCDETAAAIVRRDPSEAWVYEERAVVASQAKLHEKYGGVYPEVASREHIRQILPVISDVLDLPIHEPNRLPPFKLAGIDYLAVTVGPGLIGSLLVGTQTIATLGYATGIPILPVNHLAGHIYASFVRPHPTPLPSTGEGDVHHSLSLESRERVRVRDLSMPPKFPLISLVVSGGHTMLLYMKGHHQYELFGQTRDDAAGEAFDKVAKLLGLGYPGGPLISELAKKGDRDAYKFPIGLAHEATCDFSFSGLKTAVLREVQKAGSALTQATKANIAASFEKAVIEALLLKTSRALDAAPVYDFILGGGVAQNTYLRTRLAALLAHRSPPVRLHLPPPGLSTDNATVIGAAAAFSDLKPVSPFELETYPRFPLV